MKLGTEKLSDLWPEMERLLELHYHEVAHFQDIPLNPDKQMYKAIEDGGALHTFTARDDSGALVGYAIFFLKKAIHYRDSTQASQDVLFIDPTKRGFGLRFIKFCDDELRRLGAQVVYHHVKLAHDFGPILKRLGYQAVETIWGKRLDQ